MITPRSYANSIEAGMTKSTLEAHDISCALADENANVYGGAPLAMPVRLLVSEDQVDEAKQVLEDAEKLARSDAAERELSVKDTAADILDELKKIRSKIETNTTLVVLLFVGLAFYIFIELKSSSAPARSRQSLALHFLQRGLRGVKF